MPTPIYAPTIPSEDESPELPRRNFPTSSKRAEMFSPSVPQSSASGSYAFVHTPNSEEDNPMFQPDSALFRVRKLTEAMKIPRGRGQVMTDALRVLFHEPDKSQAFPNPIIEVRDNVGVKRFKFDPEYAEQLTVAMHLVTSTLNEYLLAAGKPRSFSFSKSSHYEMEFSELVYRRWATRLVLESFERRLLARILLAKEAIDAFIADSQFNPGKGPPRIASPAFSTSTVFAADVRRIITNDTATSQSGSPQAEDQRWVQQLRQEVDVTFSSLVATTARKLAQGVGLVRIATNTPTLQEAASVEEPMRDVTTAFAGLELATPQPVQATPMTQTLVDKWNASQQLEAQPGSAKEQSGTTSSHPLEYYMSERPNLRQFFASPETEQRAPSRARSLPQADPTCIPLSRPARRASETATTLDRYANNWQANLSMLQSGPALPIPRLTRPDNARAQSVKNQHAPATTVPLDRGLPRTLLLDSATAATASCQPTITNNQRPQDPATQFASQPSQVYHTSQAPP